MMSIAALLPRAGGAMSGARVAYGAMGPTAARAPGGRARARGHAVDAAGIARAAAACATGSRPADDALASAWYRREVAAVHLRRLLLTRMERRVMAKTPVSSPSTAAPRRVRRTGPAPARRAAPRRRRPGAEIGLRPGHLRRLHGADRRRAASGLPDAGRNRRRPRVDTAAVWPTGRALMPLQDGLHGRLCRPVRLSARPGMLMAAKALLDAIRNPSRDEVVEAISGNHLPLHRLRADHQRHPRRAAAGGKRAAPEETADGR